MFAATCLVFAAPAGAQKLHVLVVSDQSEWAHWGEHLPNIIMDVVHLSAVLENNVPTRQLDLQSMPIEMQPGSPGDILNQLKGFRVGTDDTLMFYFTGHGEVDDKGHYLNLEMGKLYRSRIMETMLGKHPRLAVLITDCCNVRGDKFAYMAPNVQTQPPQTVAPLFQTLFFDPKGVVDINSSSPGESAFFFTLKDEFELPQGSLFTRTFSKYLEKHRQQTASWDNLLTTLSFQVHQAFRENYPAGVKSSVKGRIKQEGQTVYAIAYPGMPDKKGPRTGITVRDHAGTGALIIDVLPRYPGAHVFDIAENRYASLKPDQVILKANGKEVPAAKDFDEIAKTSPQVLRLTIDDPQLGNRDYLMRLRY